jgi:RHS repeat-associated protein
MRRSFYRYTILTAILIVLTMTAEAQTENYVRTYTAQDATESETELVGWPKEQVQMSTQYVDGLGRPMQVVNWQGSPLGNDVVQHIDYDAFGREQYQYLPYVANEVGGAYKSSAVDAINNFYNGASTLNTNVAKDESPFSRTVFEASPLNRVLKQGAPGAAWQPDEDYETEDKAMAFEYTTNGEDEVYLWEVLDDQCVLGDGSYYEPNELYVTVIKDENWESGNDGTVREYKDKQGRVMLKRTYESGQPHDTYYVYDDFGNLRFVLPPEALGKLADSGEEIPEGSAGNVLKVDTELTDANPGVYYYLPGVTVTFAEGTFGPGFEVKPYPVSVELLDQYMFSYKYDARQRMVEKKVPGAEPVYMVYDKRDRLVLTQDGNQRGDNEWTFIKYDVLNRPVLTGIIVDETNTTWTLMQDAVNTHYNVTTNPMYEVRTGDWNGSDHGYTDQSYPVGIDEYGYLTVSYYDDYSFIPAADEGTYAFDDGNGINDGPQHTTPRGLTTGGKVKVLGDNEFLKSTVYFDRKYRVIQSRGDHYNNGTQDSYSAYDFIGQVLKTKTVYHDADQDIAMTGEFEYDHMGRLKNAWHQMNEEAPVLTTSHSYNELGELISKGLHHKEEGDVYVQNVDYRYNIRGWLTNINHASRTDGDLFGMDLQYETDALGLGGTAQYNGNISGMAWSNESYSEQKAYSFGYDKLNRLKDANYKEKGTLWDTNVGHFSVTGIDYDKNGNIGHLNRKESNTPIDALVYTYEGNRLLNVDDTENNDGGFKDGAEEEEEYLYDDNGNMITDKNKGIATIKYNELNLPEIITFEDGRYLEYIYDAAGIKVAQKVYKDGAGTLATKETKYVGGMIFENDTLRTIQTVEGRIVAEKVANDYVYDYQYYLRDHLGNNRVVFKSDEIVYLATMEEEYATEEEATFKNVESTRENNSTYNNTEADQTVTSPSYSSMLNSHLTNTDGSRRIIGPAKGLKVYPGDVVDMEVWARYEQVDENETSINAFLFAAMTASFGITPGDNPQVYNAFNSFIGSTVLFDQAPGDRPKAFLNYIFFDKYYENPHMGLFQVPDAAKNSHQLISYSKSITEEGYIYIYVSNESTLDVNVYFDDLKITHTSESMVVQANDYYPFGLTMTPSDFQREGEEVNKFLYNGKELQTDLDLDWYDYGFRFYDPSIARFSSVDPLSENYNLYSPYHYALNNPIRYADFMGMGAEEEGKEEDKDKESKAQVPLPLPPVLPAPPGILPLPPGEDLNGLRLEDLLPHCQEIKFEDKNESNDSFSPKPKGEPRENDDDDDDNENVVYRAGSATNKNFTPRMKDNDGLSTFRTPAAALQNKPGKYQKIDLNRARALGFQIIESPNGHVSIRAPSDDAHKQWQSSREGLDQGKSAHPLTHLLKATIKKQDFYPSF